MSIFLTNFGEIFFFTARAKLDILPVIGRRIKEYVPVAQLDRASDSDSEGRWFESSRAYQNVLMKDAMQKTPHESVALSHIMRYF